MPTLYSAMPLHAYALFSQLQFLRMPTLYSHNCNAYALFSQLQRLRMPTLYSAMPKLFCALSHQTPKKGASSRDEPLTN
jgi:hypothetical protein